MFGRSHGGESGDVRHSHLNADDDLFTAFCTIVLESNPLSIQPRYVLCLTENKGLFFAYSSGANGPGTGSYTSMEPTYDKGI